MNTLSPAHAPTLRHVVPTPATATKVPQYLARNGFDGARGLAGLLLAAAVAALVVVADRLVNTWADGHLLAGWVFLWLVIFAGLALFAGTARSLASRAMASLDDWSRARAELRAEARFWEAAKSDPRLKAEWATANLCSQNDDLEPVAAQAPSASASEQVVAAPQVGVSIWGRFPERLAAMRERNIHLYYI